MEAIRLRQTFLQYLPQIEIPFIGTETLGEAFEPEQKFENPTGPDRVPAGLFRKTAGITPIPGPFADGCERKRI